MSVLVCGESYKEAATICNCKVGTVKSRVNRARSMIIRDLGADTLKDFLVNFE
jgi:DNA-directed RNA polymerase specialized sigma24 family protein